MENNATKIHLEELKRREETNTKLIRELREENKRLIDAQNSLPPAIDQAEYRTLRKTVKLIEKEKNKLSELNELLKQQAKEKDVLIGKLNIYNIENSLNVGIQDQKGKVNFFIKQKPINEQIKQIQDAMTKTKQHSQIMIRDRDNQINILNVNI